MMSLQPHLRRLVLGGLTLLILLALAGGLAMIFYLSYYSPEARFARSKPELDAFAARVMATSSPAPSAVATQPAASTIIAADTVIVIIIPLIPDAPIILPLRIVSHSVESRYARSKLELEAFAARVMAANPSTPITIPRHLGEFEASDTLRLPHGFLFRADFGHPLDWNGFAYSTVPLPREMPDPQPPFGTMYFKPLEGNWYIVGRN